MSAAAAETSISSILAMVWRRKLLILISLCACLGIAWASLSYLRPRYTASVSILLDPKGPEAFDAGGEFVSRSVDSVKVGSVVSVIQSNALLDRVVKSEHLTDDPAFRPGRPDGIAGFIRALTSSEKEEVDTTEAGRVAAASEILQKMMKVTRDGFTYVIKIDVTSGDPRKVRRLAQAIGDAYLNDQIEAKYDSVKRNFNWLSERLGEMKGELIASEDMVQKIRRKFGLTETEKGADLTLAAQEISELSKQVVAAQADVTQKEARVDLANSLRAKGGDIASLPEIESSPIIVQLKQKKAEAASKLAELSRHYGNSHPERLRAESDLKRAEVNVADEVKRIVSASEGEYKAALFRANALQSQMKRLTESEAKSADGLGRLRQAQRVAEANKRLYDTFLNRFKEIEQRQTIADVEARIISPPRLPTEASFPRPLPFLLGGLGFGLALGVAAAFLLDRMETTFSSAAQVERTLGVPVLATVPLLQRRDLGRGSKRLSIIEYTAKNPISRYADSLRGIRLGLQDGSSSRGRIVNFASAMPDEGKSTLAACVAISAAMAGAKTILIDCDLWNASTSQTFECESRPGVADVLANSSTLDDIVVPTTIPLLSIVPAGACSHALPDLVNSRRLKQLIRSAAQSADLVIIDSAAIEQVSDAIVTAQIADETVLIVKWRSSDKLRISWAIDQLERVRGKLTGIVLNSVDTRKAEKYGCYANRSGPKRQMVIPALRA